MKSYPKVAIIELTNRCNLSCIFCPHSSDDFAATDMPAELISKLEPMLPYLDEVGIFGLGETFLAKTWREFFVKIKSHRAMTRIFTSGTMLSDDDIELLIKHGLDNLTFSIDTTDAEQYKALRPHGQLDTVLKNIDRLNERKAAHKTDKPALWLNAVLFNGNSSQMPKLVELARDKAMDRVDIVDLFEYSPFTAPFGFPSESDAHVAENISHASNLASRYGIAFSAPRRFDWIKNAGSWHKMLNYFRIMRYRLINSANRLEQFYILFQRMTRRFNNRILFEYRHRRAFCTDPFSMVVITCKGEVLPCCYPHAPTMGSLSESSLDEIWQGQAFENLRLRLQRGEPPTVCRQCKKD